MNIPPFTLDRQYQEIGSEIESEVLKVLKGGSHTYPEPFAMSSHRFDTPPFVTTDHMGFRIVERTNGVEIEEIRRIKSLLKTIDILGRETTNKGFQLHIYDDGSVEKKYVIK